eukprot:1150961-Pelagomonas_calceolata.AAC.19
MSSIVHTPPFGSNRVIPAMKSNFATECEISRVEFIAGEEVSRMQEEQKVPAQALQGEQSEICCGVRSEQNAI